jgi:predicted secreted hydrolase
MPNKFFLLTLLFLFLLAVGCVDDDEDCTTCDSSDDDSSAEPDDDDDDDSAGICVEGETYCGPGDVPEICTDGQWVVQEPCGYMQYCNFGLCVDTHLDLPRDESPHRDLVEWWYWTGNMTDDQGNLYGFELTYFYGLSLILVPAWMVHVAIIDESALVHSHVVMFDYFWPERYPAPFEISVNAATAARPETGLYEISGRAGDYAFDLTLVDIKGAVHHGGNGTIRMTTKTTDSFYYSRPRMQVTGILEKGGTPLAVTGEAWMDHQWGNWMPLGMIGWDWFSLQFDDGTELMNFIFRGDRQDPLVIDNALGTYVDENGDQISLSQDEVIVTPLGEWTSEKSGGTYPQNWRIQVPGLDLDVTLTTPLQDQEMPNPAWNYWEGLIHIEGTKQGRTIGGLGFVELSGYAKRSFIWW